MTAISSQLLRMEEYRRTLNSLDAGRSPVLLTGLAQVHKAQFAHALVRDTGRGALVLTPDEQSAARLAEEINLVAGEQAALHYPERELVFLPMEGVSREYEHMRLAILGKISTDGQTIVVASVGAALQQTLPPEQFSACVQTIREGQTLPQKELLEFLIWAGYTRLSLIHI